MNLTTKRAISISVIGVFLLDVVTQIDAIEVPIEYTPTKRAINALVSLVCAILMMVLTYNLEEA